MADGDNVSVAAQLEKLEALRARGALSEDEYQNLKTALVAKMSPVPKSSGASAWIVGALAAIVVVTVIFLLAMPRHGTDGGTQSASQPAARPTAQPAMLPPLKSQSLPPAFDRAANEAPPAPTEPPPTFQTSFDCAQARRLALRLICTNPNLAAQDMQLAGMYRRARANAVDPSQLSDQQQEWLAARDSCTNLGCLSSVYAARRAELAQWITN